MDLNLEILEDEAANEEEGEEDEVTIEEVKEAVQALKEKNQGKIPKNVLKKAEILAMKKGLVEDRNF
jgi:hypothetical protein